MVNRRVVIYDQAYTVDVAKLGNRRAVGYNQANIVDVAMFVQSCFRDSICYDVMLFAITLRHLPFALLGSHSETDCNN